MKNEKRYKLCNLCEDYVVGFLFIPTNSINWPYKQYKLQYPQTIHISILPVFRALTELVHPRASSLSFVYLFREC